MQRCRLALLAGSAVALGALLGALLGGCSSPLDREQDDLRKSLMESIRREAAEATRYPQTRETERTSRSRALDLKPKVMQELERTSGITSYRPGGSNDLLEPTLLGTPQNAVTLSLERAIATAVANNLNIQFAKLAVAVDEARLLEAQAAFDWTFFTNLTWSNLDQEQIAQQSSIPPSTRSFNQRQVVDSQIGLRRRLTSGGTFTVQQALTYTDVTLEPSSFARPNPADEAAVTVQLDQPLLRNFGSDTALTEVRLAANAERDQIQQLKSELNQTVGQVEQQYWRLVQAYGELLIAKRLLQAGEKVRQILEVRKGNMDANPAQFANAVAAVESRRGDVIQAENTLRNASDQLKQLMNDPELTVGSEVLLLPADNPVDAPTQFSLLDSLTTAIGRRPEVQRAILALDDSSIRRRQAENQILPQLDLRLQTRLSALTTGADSSLREQFDGSLVDFLVGLAFEQPIGNRAAEGRARGRRVEQQQSVITYRDVVSRIVLEVKTALRNTETAYDLIEQRRAARLAAAEDLRTTEVREEIVQGLTPEQLDLKLRKQESLAGRETQELAALTGYNTGIAQLYTAMGTALERNRIRFEVSSSLGEQRQGALPPPPDPIFGLPAPLK